MIQASNTTDTLEKIGDVLQRIEATLSTLKGRIEQIEERIEEMSAASVPDRPISAAEAARLLGIDQSTLCRFRKNWIEGVHYFKKGEYQGCLYNAELILNWQRNRFNTEAHQAAIEQWLAKQPENQRRKRK
jgi:hypothetical protein